MNTKAQLIAYPSCTTQGDAIITKTGSPYVVKIRYQDTSVIILEEHDRGRQYGVRLDEFFIKRDKFIFYKTIYKGTTDYSTVDWLSSELPVDLATKQPAWKTLLYMLRSWLCAYYNVEVISPLSNHEFEEYFEFWRSPETGNYDVHRVYYLQDLPHDFMPSLFLNITTAAALTCSSASDFESLISEIARKIERWRDKHDDQLLKILMNPIGWRF